MAQYTVDCDIVDVGRHLPEIIPLMRRPLPRPLPTAAAMHTTVAGDFAMTRSQWLIRGVVDADGRPVEVRHHGMEVHRRLLAGTWVFFIGHPSGADASWTVKAPPPTE